MHIRSVMWPSHPCNVSSASLSANFPAYTSVPLWFCLSHVPELQQFPLWLPAHSQRGQRGIRFQWSAWLTLLICTLFKGKELFQLADLTNTGYSWVEVQGGRQRSCDDRRWGEKKLKHGFSLPIYFQSSWCFFRWPSAIDKAVVCLCAYLNGKWDTYWYSRQPMTVRKQ